MVIGFSVKEARDQLLNEGIVYTYRWHRRSFFSRGKGKVESTWANTGRRKSSIGDVDIEEIGQMDYSTENLKPYLHQSGFNKLWRWQEKIMNMNAIPTHPDGWLYKVTLKSPEVKQT